jgi:hypothetical protein
MPRSRLHLAAPVLAALALLHAEPCGAQTIDRKSAAEAPPRIVPEDTRPGRSGSSQEPLGKRLDRTDSVLHPPPGVDPGITIPPPETGSNMPVITPPGASGGDAVREPDNTDRR